AIWSARSPRPRKGGRDGSCGRHGSVGPPENGPSETRWLRLDASRVQAMLDGPRCNLGPGVEAEPPEDSLDVAVCRPFSEYQLGSDLAIGQPTTEEDGDVTLSPRQSAQFSTDVHWRRGRLSRPRGLLTAGWFADRVAG